VESDKKIAAGFFRLFAALSFMTVAAAMCGPGSSMTALKGEDEEVCRIAGCDREFASMTSAAISLKNARGLLLKGKFNEVIESLDPATVKYLEGIAEKEATTVQKILKRGYIHKPGDPSGDPLVFLSGKGDISFRDAKSEFGARQAEVEAVSGDGKSMLFTVKFDGSKWRVSLLKEVSFN